MSGNAQIKSKWTGGDLVFSKVVSTANPQIEFGVDGTGLDVKFYGDTASAYMEWDESADALQFSGGAKIEIDGQYLNMNPSGFWASCPYLAYPDMSLAYQWSEDFIGHVNWPATTGAGGGWKLTGDATYDVLNAAGTVGGIIQVAPETGSNNELYAQLGTLGTETYIEYVKNSGLKSWVEFRVAYTSITNAANTFVGLAEEGAAAADFIADAGNDFADKDLVGFIIWEGDPDAIDINHQKAGGTLADVGLAAVPVANTFLTLGIYFDGVQTVSFYANGTAVGTADLDTATFPTGEELSPIIAMKQGAADNTLSIDWIRMVVER